MQKNKNVIVFVKEAIKRRLKTTRKNGVAEISVFFETETNPNGF